MLGFLFGHIPNFVFLTLPIFQLKRFVLKFVKTSIGSYSMNINHYWHLSRHRFHSDSHVLWLLALTPCDMNIMAPKIYIKKELLRVLLVMNFMSCMKLENRAATSADRVSTGRQSPTASNLLLFFLSLFLQLVLGLTHVLQFFLDG